MNVALDTGLLAAEVGSVAARFLSERLPVEVVRQAPGWDRDQARALWRDIAALGWATVAGPPRAGGLEDPETAVAEIFREVGRNLCPAPLLDGLAAVPALARALPAEGSARLEAAIGTSALISAAVLPDGPAVPPAADPWSGADLRGGRLTGAKTLVGWAGEADLVVVTARRRDRPALALVEAGHAGCHTEAQACIDVGFRPYRVILDRAPAEELATGPAAEAAWREATRLARLAVASEAAGIIERVAALAVDHARARLQFGRPVGAFQAVKHLLADLWLDGYSVQAACRRAARPGLAPAERRLATDVAKVHAARAGRRAVETALQVHGGIGFTADHTLHLFFKRMLTLSGSWGEATELERLIGAAELAGENNEGGA